MHIGRKRLGNAVLELEDVRYIKAELSKGTPPRKLAELFEVGVETIRRISRGESWAWVKAEVEVTPADISDAEIEASLRRLTERKDDD